MFVDATTKLSLALVLALCCATSVSSANLNMSNICLLVGDGYSIASENSCNNYYYCSGGLATEQTCGSNLYFSKDQQTCVQPNQVNCIADGSAPCADRPVGSWAAMPNSCSGYYYCSANGPLAGYCPNNENFDAVSQSCQYPSVFGCSINGGGSGDSVNGGVTVNINLCSFIKNGIYFGSPSSCSTWNTCNNNIMSSGACSNSMVFNVKLRTCDYASHWGCSQVTNDPNLVNSTSTNGGSCSTVGAMKASTLCDSYYYCDGNTYQLTQCSSGYYYDIPSQQCVPRLQARNNCDRCEGTTLSFVNSYSSVNCTGYLYCQNGVEQSSGSCQSGYFDEVAGACLVNSTQPMYACCNPNVDGPVGTTILPITTDASGATDETTVGSTVGVTNDDTTTEEGSTAAPTTEAPTTEETTTATTV